MMTVVALRATGRSKRRPYDDVGVASVSESSAPTTLLAQP